MKVEVAVKNRQRQIRMDIRKIKRTINKALTYLRDNAILPYRSIEISVVLVNDNIMQKLNRQYRGKNKTTDVLSFPQIEKKNILSKPQPHLVLGDIVINIHQTKRQAVEHGLALHEEIVRLLIHGLLHLLGYDHEKNKYQALKMRRLEKKLLESI